MKKYLNYLIHLAIGLVGFVIASIDYSIVRSLEFSDYHWWGKIGVALICIPVAYAAGGMMFAIWLWIMAVYCQIFGHKWRLFNPNPKYPTEKCRRCRKVQPAGLHLSR